MKNLTLLLQVVKELNEGQFSIENYGIFKEKRKVIDGEMYFYTPKSDALISIVVYYSNNNPYKISFTGNNLDMILEELELIFGKYSTGYNFRDNITVFSFKDLKGAENLKEITIKAEGDCTSNTTQKFQNFTLIF